MAKRVTLTDYEQITFDIIAQLHECPWYKRIFKKKKSEKEQFTLSEESCGIGSIKTMTCTCCGRKFDITDVSCW